MKQETFEKAAKLKNELDSLNHIVRFIEEDEKHPFAEGCKTHSWSLITSESIRFNTQGYFVPERVRDKFDKIINETILEIKNEIEAL